MFKFLLLLSAIAFGFEDAAALNTPLARESSRPGMLRDLYKSTGAWGMSCSINLSGCVPLPECKESVEYLHTFSHKLVNLIEMTAYGCPQIVWFGSGNKAGYTLVQLIETSAIVAHFAGSDIYLDVFSCKPYEPSLVAAFASHWFQAEEWSVVNVLR